MPASFIREINITPSSANSPAFRNSEFEIIRSSTALKVLAPAWRKLTREVEALPFQSPDWLIPFANIFVGEDKLRVLVWFEERELVAVAPFYIHAEGSSRKLLLLGSGVSDYLDILCRP